jgi:thiamine-phosphate pyrophosphorylase
LIAVPVTAARKELLQASRLYLVCGARPGGRDPEPVLQAALAGGVDVVQLREKDAPDDEVLRAAEVFRRVATEHEVPFILNDRPDLAVRAGADGVHLGQDDMPVAQAREIVGDELIVGRSTHTPAQVDAANDEAIDYFASGPVHATPTKPGRPAVGLELVRHAAARARHPWFAIGGIDAETIGAAVEAGARRVVVVRAIAEAEDPEAAARGLRAVLEAAGGPA